MIDPDWTPTLAEAIDREFEKLFGPLSEDDRMIPILTPPRPRLDERSTEVDLRKLSINDWPVA